MSARIGILGIGTYVPPHVRTNDWWSNDVVSRWGDKAVRGEAQADSADLTAEQRIVIELQASSSADPFRGARERRVMPEGMSSTEMEALAAQDALERVGCGAHEIDLLLVHSVVPDYLDTNAAAPLHRRLGLPGRCFSLSIEAACNSFQLQLALAESMVLSGRANKALLVQSCAASRILPYEEAYSVAFGDAATAVIVGRVAPDEGLLGQYHATDGAFDGALVTGKKGGWWWEEGRNVLYSRERGAAFRMLLDAGKMARTVATPALEMAGVSPEEVSFYASHQGTCWFRAATQSALGLVNARSVDTFPWAGSVFGANIPLVLASAQNEGILRKGDIVLMFSGGSGVTLSSTVLRWSE